mmetsp:Transcript_1467/g.2024  ORF Transcript_1467/g.2024 Transcript_1467/m.2024 type:complete len:222 (-) Transcript_1467:103-768(-)
MKISQVVFLIPLVACFAVVGRSVWLSTSSDVREKNHLRGLGHLVHLKDNPKFLFDIDVTTDETNIDATRTAKDGKDGKAGKMGRREARVVGQIESILSHSGDPYPGVRRQYMFPIGFDFSHPDLQHIVQFYVNADDYRGEYVKFVITTAETGKVLVKRTAIVNEAVYVVPFLHGKFGVTLDDGNNEIINYKEGTFKLSVNNDLLLEGKDIPRSDFVVVKSK